MTRVLVLGAGVSGLAAAALARDRDMTVTIYTRDQPELALEKGFPVASGGWDPVLLTGTISLSPAPASPSVPCPSSKPWNGNPGGRRSSSPGGISMCQWRP